MLFVDLMGMNLKWIALGDNEDEQNRNVYKYNESQAQIWFVEHIEHEFQTFEENPSFSSFCRFL